MVMFDLMASGLVKIAEIIYRTKAIESFFFFCFFFYCDVGCKSCVVIEVVGRTLSADT